ncbi:hypothetical protein [Allocoleopsis sp.]|uniref:hypothetical protein n=1 Tax=Allocoleopsis sp. TaxID=3088169 RepID=UPI002FD36C19
MVLIYYGSDTHKLNLGLGEDPKPVIVQNLLALPLQSAIANYPFQFSHPTISGRTDLCAFFLRGAAFQTILLDKSDFP